MFAHDDKTNKIGAIFGLVLLLFTVIAMVVGVRLVGMDRLQAMVAQAGPFAPLAFIAVKVITNVVAPLSAGPVQISAGMLFGLWPGTLYSIVGEVLGGTLNFLIARYLGWPIISRFVGTKGTNKIEHYYKRLGGWRALLHARLLLFAVYDFVSYAAGLTSIKLRDYFLISLVAGFVPTFLSVAIGTLVAGSFSVWFVLEITGFVLLTVVVLRAPYFKKREAKAKQAPVERSVAC